MIRLTMEICDGECWGWSLRLAYTSSTAVFRASSLIAMVSNLIENGGLKNKINQTIELGMQEPEVVTELNALKLK